MTVFGTFCPKCKSFSFISLLTVKMGIMPLIKQYVIERIIFFTPLQWLLIICHGSHKCFWNCTLFCLAYRLSFFKGFYLCCFRCWYKFIVLPLEVAMFILHVLQSTSFCSMSLCLNPKYCQITALVFFLATINLLVCIQLLPQAFLLET